MSKLKLWMIVGALVLGTAGIQGCSSMMGDDDMMHDDMNDGEMNDDDMMEDDDDM